jgi:tRNA pseudouridine38-40 synthase
VPDVQEDGKHDEVRSQHKDEQGCDELETKSPRDDASSPSHAIHSQAVPSTSEDVQAEHRRPKRKVAVLISYSGTGYKGMQM